MRKNQVEWRNPFWACCQPTGLGCMACWCPCILFGKTHHRLKDPSMSNYSMCNFYCCGWLALACTCGLQSIFQAINRRRMRKNFGLKGHACTDCLGAFCCLCCGLVQEDKEAKLLLKEAGNTIQGYQRIQEMSAAKG